MKRVKGAAVVVLAVGMLLSTTAWAAEKEASGGRAAQGGTATVELQDGAAGQPVAKAELNESQRQALEKIYQIVPELKELSVEGMYNEGEATWGVVLNDNTGDVGPDIRRTHANLTFKTDTGELLRFDIRNPNWASVEFPASGLAKEKAAEFARQVLGDKMEDYQMSDQIGYGSGGARDDKGNEIRWASANVQFERLINGIPFLNSGIRVSVDAAGHVTEYYTEGSYKRNDSIKDSGPDPAVFPDPALAVTKEAAAEIYAGLLEMKLNYVERQPMQYPYPILGDEEVETRPVLIYTPTPAMYAFIDAVTGKPLAESHEQPLTSRIRLAGEGKKLAAGTPEAAAALLAAETGIDISGMKFIREGDYLNSGIKVKEYSWHSEPQTEQGGINRFLTISTLADTGQVVGFSLYDESGRGQKGTVTRETAQETAMQFVQRYLEQGAVELVMSSFQAQEDSIPDWVDRSKLPDNEQRPEFHFTFTLTHQGIPVSDRYNYVTVDGLTGRITAYSSGNGSSSVNLPDSGNVVTAEAAKAEFLKSQPLRLVYVWPEYFGQKAPKPLLVYLPDYSYGGKYIDALTGKTVTLEVK
ncbi:DUF4901 domain-containing protein [Pelotomaculum terephthalicicum JT]|uniref:DUF4901 domain-containing protein n=1 Tax=Pelotomaculum TaxID=191373 RepID=UPI0009CBE5FA|nr:MULTISPECIES: DUF4901 domain-containing protein [Pelotomaculum]MCG9968918.1 DUF4901 domain-containing protein [Pelotomaculum terephthalicicum JT]OPX90367.1 MAG: hypothetical protein A4E54_00706 [Pelotomaculum sp. PtaB.Bin117]OPY60948.1 MAG: hypothetical protein A4E56_02373 [Pelotomaculum sp. PtaU1.Bin065]